MQLTCREYSVMVVLWSGRSGDVTTMLQAAIEITCHDHSTTA